MGRGTRNYDEVWAKLDELRSLREALCDLVGSDDTNVLLRWIEDQSHKNLYQVEAGHQKFIYLVQSEAHLENHTVKVGFCKNLLSRWGNNWERFTNKKVFSSPFKGDAEVHLHLRQTFERDLENGRETYFGDFNEIANAVETFISIGDK
jgi:hypothetical protein